MNRKVTAPQHKLPASETARHARLASQGASAKGALLDSDGDYDGDVGVPKGAKARKAAANYFTLPSQMSTVL